MTKLEELQAKMAKAIAENDVAAIEAIAGEIVASKKDRAKVEAERLQKEAEQLAGKRETLSAKIHEAVKALGLDKEIIAVKGWGFTYKVDRANPNESDIVYKAVSLSTQQVKARKTGGGGGATGKSKDEYGLSLSEIVEKFGTHDEQAAIAAADTNSKSWQAKMVIKKRAIAEGLLTPVK